MNYKAKMKKTFLAINKCFAHVSLQHLFQMLQRPQVCADFINSLKQQFIILNFLLFIKIPTTESYFE